MIFWVAIVKEPKEKEQKDGKLEELILSPEIIIAKDEKSAAIKTIKKAELKDEDIDQIKVVVRPF